MNALSDKLVLIPTGEMSGMVIFNAPTRVNCCGEVVGYVINRLGQTRCNRCDATAQMREETNARVTLKEMAAALFIRCRCPVSKDPSELFKCTCEASYPENKPPEDDEDSWYARSGTLLPPRRR